MEAARVLGAVLGGFILLGTSMSVLQTLVMPGGRVGRLFKSVDQTIDRAFRMATRPLPRIRIACIEPRPLLSTEQELIRTVESKRNESLCGRDRAHQ